MPSFKLPMNEKNLRIAEFIEDAKEGVKISHEDGRVKVEFERDLTVARFMLEGAVGSLTDREWRSMILEVRRTLEGAKLRNVSDQFFTVQALRQHCIGARVNLLEKGMICKAAEIEHESPSTFIRKAAVEKAKSILERWERKMRKGGYML